MIGKGRKTPSDFHLTSFLVVQNNLSQVIQGVGNSSASAQNTKDGGKKEPGAATSQHLQPSAITAGISPIKSQRKVAGGNASALNSLQGTVQPAKQTIG